MRIKIPFNSVTPVCNNSDIRLVGGRNESEGRVEICQMGRWGTVCEDNWDDTDALVVCRQLGILTDGKSVPLISSTLLGVMCMLVFFAQLAEAIATSRFRFINFGRGTGPIFLDDVGCTGSEVTLDGCPHNGIGIHDCVHNLVAGVICSQQGSQSLYNHMLRHI